MYTTLSFVGEPAVASGLAVPLDCCGEVAATRWSTRGLAGYGASNGDNGVVVPGGKHHHRPLFSLCHGLLVLSLLHRHGVFHTMYGVSMALTAESAGPWIMLLSSSVCLGRTVKLCRVVESVEVCVGFGRVR